MVAAAPAAMAAVDPDQAALDALVRARLAEEAGNPAEALAALQSLASQAPDLPGLRAEMLERAIDAGDLIAAVSYTHLDVYKRQIPNQPSVSYLLGFDFFSKAISFRFSNLLQQDFP